MNLADAEVVEVPTRLMARVLGVTVQRLNQLVQSGVVVKLARGKFDLVDTTNRYISNRISNPAEKRTDASMQRARDARADEIELRMAEKRRELIPAVEALEAADMIAGLYLNSIGGLPARLTRNPSERQRIEAICDTERQRLTDKFSNIGRALQAGKPLDQAGAEDPA